MYKYADSFALVAWAVEMIYLAFGHSSLYQPFSPIVTITISLSSMAAKI